MTDASKARVWLGGGIFKGPTSAPAPTGTSGAPTDMTELGFISEDGIEVELPEAGDSEPIKAWQNGSTVRVIRTPTEDNPTWTFTMLETSIETIETYFGVTVDSAATEGSFTFSSNTQRPFNSYVFNFVDGENLRRDYIPRGIVTSVGSHTISSTEVTGYQVTIEAELDPAAGFNFKSFLTALKTVV